MAWLSHIPTWVAWVSLYTLTLCTVPPRKLCRGWATRYVLRRVIPPKRFWNGSPWMANTYRYYLWLTANMLADHWVKPSRSMNDLLFWGVYILLLLDDLFNGDDEPKKRWEAMKNKIKWLWTPAQEPVRVFDGF